MLNEVEFSDGFTEAYLDKIFAENLSHRLTLMAAPLFYYKKYLTNEGCWWRADKNEAATWYLDILVERKASTTDFFHYLTSKNLTWS